MHYWPCRASWTMVYVQSTMGMAHRWARGHKNSTRAPLGSFTCLSPPLTSQINEDKRLAQRTRRKYLGDSGSSAYLEQCSSYMPALSGLHGTLEYYFLMRTSREQMGPGMKGRGTRTEQDKGGHIYLRATESVEVHSS